MFNSQLPFSDFIKLFFMLLIFSLSTVLARTYRQDLLRERREQFYRAVFAATARWQAKG